MEKVATLGGYAPNWMIWYQWSTGYRTPTASEMYFTFESAYGNWAENPHLDSEKRSNHRIFLQGKGKYGSLDLTLYQTRYRDFLFEQETSITRNDPTCDWYAAYYKGCTLERHGTQVCKKTESYLKTEPYSWLNAKAFIFDLFGYYKPTKNITLRAGIYNLLNRKYHTWDSLRGLNRRATVDSVDWDKGQGLERFYAPGRNYSASVEVRF